MLLVVALISESAGLNPRVMPTSCYGEVIKSRVRVCGVFPVFCGTDLKWFAPLMTSRRKIQLRTNASSQSLEPKKATAKKTVEEQREYERLKKQRQRAAKRCPDEGPAKRGPKTKINIKEMTDEQRKAYNRERKRISRDAKKLRSKINDDIDTEEFHGNEKNETEDSIALTTSASVAHSETNMALVPSEEGATVIRQIKSPSRRGRKMPRKIVHSF